MDRFKLFPFPNDSTEDSDLLLVQTLHRWAETEVFSKRLELREDYEKLLMPAMQKLFVDVELQKMIWPEDCGGIGLNKREVARTLAMALEQIGRADCGIGYISAVTLTLCSSFVFDYNFKEELCRRSAPLFCRADHITIGSLVLPSFKEGDPSEKAPVFRGKPLPARARRDGDKLVISGEKMRPLNSGCDALLFGVLCALEDSDEPALILVPGDSPGLIRGEPIIKTGLTASKNTDITLADVSVPAGNLIFHGEDCLRRMLSWFYLNISAVTVGSLFTVFEIIKEWGDTRVIKGKGNLFKENPLTASVMAEIGHEIMLSRLLLYQLVAMFSRPEDFNHREGDDLYVPALSIVSHITQNAEKTINQTMELMGSAGYATEWNLERYWRDLKTIQVHLGSWELNKMALSRYFYESQSL